MKEFKPEEIYQPISSEPFGTEKELKERNDKIINERFYKFRSIFDVKYVSEKTPESQKDK